MKNPTTFINIIIFLFLFLLWNANGELSLLQAVLCEKCILGISHWIGNTCILSEGELHLGYNMRAHSLAVVSLMHALKKSAPFQHIDSLSKLPPLKFIVDMQRLSH